LVYLYITMEDKEETKEEDFVMSDKEADYVDKHFNDLPIWKKPKKNAL